MNPDANLLQMYEQGYLHAAEQAARQSLAVRPDSEIAAHVIGLCLLARELPADAALMYERLTRRYPTEPLYWNNLGTALQGCGKLNDAEHAFASATRLQPLDPRFVTNMAFLQIAEGRIVMAKESLLASLRLDPSNGEVRIYAAQMALECGEEELARVLLRDWKSWAAVVDPSLRAELAAMLTRISRNTEGEALLRTLLADSRSGVMARARLVLLLERYNQLEEARELLAQLPRPGEIKESALRGEVMEANAMIAARDKDPVKARSMLEALLEIPDAERGKTTTWFLLAKLSDKLDDPVACMKYLQLAHENQLNVARQLVPELLEPSTNPLNTTNFYVTQEQFESWKPSEALPLEQSPIFVLGFPRSGTTMLEQMLDAHPGMASMDERPFVQRVIERMQSMGLQYPEQLGELDSAQCEMLRRVYWTAVAEVVQLKPGQRLVDKNPLTMLRLPLLVRLFPNARIIFVVRHPCDVVLSNYMQHFNAPAFTALCSTLPRLATGYAAAMRFWHAHVALLKPQVFEWNYEDAIRDFDANVRKLGAFLELDDVAPLHDFSEHAKRKGYIGTPSYAQVVQPVYSGSIGRWKRYREYFEPILPMLEPAMRHWGYDA